ncbi:MAG TPA: hypothetical protein VME63_15575 [Dyella sp.]|uniref:hypothetical protein n=1 Tax=Dyella sp. TaxID=1869338 RepID=UPI002C91FEBF|nr:hypothetical protein [Dyella sp.]HTV86820.1 hypothetical protein [Dyella sp.]
MKLETLLLKSLFTACFLICVLTVGSMLVAGTSAPAYAGNHVSVTASVSAAS